MKCTVDIRPVCPFLGGRQCIKDGWQFGNAIVHPCRFYDENAGLNDEEPCLIQRAVDKVLHIDRSRKNNNVPIDVPWTSENAPWTDEKE